MRGIIKTALFLCLLLSGCKTHQEQPASIFHRPNWWERRMDRLETWNLRHGQPIEKAKTVMCASLIVVGSVATVAAMVVLDGALKKQPGQKSTYGDSNSPNLTWP